ncbi:EPIDERMAL PATTERNING FACTOR-like protein 1 [Platanthera guangdongensis]|uniref:Epidermal patterning factor-like protein n=1 Tax=Platanthera guangdongensis TaxID=2320717 RepID=A0ABR2MXM2_9ASPA
MKADGTAAVEEEKIRLGSMPPSCHNRCNTCKPCTAVEVPTLPELSWDLAQVEPGELRPADQAVYSQHNSNYKPLGWKCRCSGRVFNP